MYMSCEPYTGSCCGFRLGNEFSSTRHRDLHPLRVSPIQFVLSFGNGGERAESKFSYVVALVFVSTLSSTSSREQHQEWKWRDSEGTHQRPEPGKRGTPGTSGVWSKTFTLRRRKQCGRTREGESVGKVRYESYATQGCLRQLGQARRFLLW